MVQPIQYPARDPNAAINAARGALDLQTAAQQLQILMQQQEAAQREQLLAQQRQDYFQQNPVDVGSQESLQAAVQALTGFGDFKSAGDLSGIGAQQAAIQQALTGAQENQAQTRRINTLTPLEAQQTRAQTQQALAGANLNVENARLRREQSAKAAWENAQTLASYGHANADTVNTLLENRDYRTVSGLIGQTILGLKQADPEAFDAIKGGFQDFDLDNDGSISPEELQGMLESEDESERTAAAGFINGLIPSIRVSQYLIDRTKGEEERKRSRDTDFAGMRAERGLKFFNDTLDNIPKVQQKVDLSQRILGILNDPNVRDTGLAAPAVEVASGVAEAFGLGNGRSAANFQELDGLLKDAALTTVERYGGNTSNYEAQTYQSVLGGITDQRSRLQASANFLASQAYRESFVTDKVAGTDISPDNAASLEQDTRKQFAKIPVMMNTEAGPVFLNEFAEALSERNPELTNDQIIAQWQRRVAKLDSSAATAYRLKN